MSAQPKYITQPEFDAALTAFSGHVDHAINMAKVEQRRDIIGNEDRLSVKIDALDTRVTTMETKIDDLKSRVDRVEHMGKLNHQMLQLVLDQLSKINKKLGVD